MSAADTSYDALIPVDQDELRSESLSILVQLTLTLACVWVLYLVLVMDNNRPPSYITPVLLLAAGLLARVSVPRYSAGACHLFPLSVLLILFLHVVREQEPLSAFAIPAVILVGSVTSTRRWMLGLALMAGSGLAALAWWQEAPLEGPYGMAILSVAIASVTAWFATRNLHVALGWATQSENQARRHMEDLRQRRAELLRVTRALQESQERLQYMNIHLKQAKLAAEEAYRVKQHFVANISHELRTPLNLIVGFSEMITTAPENYDGQPLPMAYRGDVMAIYRNARHLAELINDVLDLSQIEAGRMPLIVEPASLSDVIQEAIDMVREVVQARGLRLDVDLCADLPPMPLDSTRIRQVLLNLLTNATRYTQAGWVRVTLTRQGDEALVTVRDTGPGIPDEALTRAFQTFSQLDDRHVQEGSGLGLAISKQFVELHGGRIWIDSKLGQGTTVGFALPIPQSEHSASPSRLMATPAHRGDEPPLVLVYHEDSRPLDLLRRYVEGFTFVGTTDPQEMSTLLRETLPVAVVVDAARSEECERLIAAQDVGTRLSIISSPFPGAHQEALFGISAFLPKPVTRADLFAALERLPRQPQTILVVDDNPHVVRLAVRMLRSWRPMPQILEAFGGTEGLALARTRKPDVILLDLLMPGMDGYEFLDALHADPDLSDSQVIIFTARAAEAELYPLQGKVQVQRTGGLSATEALKAVQALLQVTTQPAGARPDTAATPAANRVG